MNWKLRAATALSVLWILVILGVASDRERFQMLLLLGLAPLTLLWGAGWVVAGILKARKKSQPDSTPEVPEQELSKALKSNALQDRKQLLLALLTCVLCVVFAYWYIDIDAASRFVGRSISAALMLGLLAFAIPKLKKSAGLISLAVFSSVLIFSTYDYKTAELDAKHDLTKLAPLLARIQSGDFPTNEELQADEWRILRPIVTTALNNLKVGRDLWMGYESQYGNLLDERVLSPKAMGSSAGREQLRRNTEEFSKAIDRFDLDLQGHLKQSAINFKLASADLDSALRTGALVGYEEAERAGAKTLNDLLAVHRKYVALLQAYYKLLASSKPVYTDGPIGMNLYFKNEADLKKFRELGSQFEKLAAEESRILRTIQNRHQEKANKLLEHVK